MDEYDDMTPNCCNATAEATRKVTRETTIAEFLRVLANVQDQLAQARVELEVAEQGVAALRAHFALG